jgi:Spy/CpxP family protein refolding chaperone
MLKSLSLALVAALSLAMSVRLAADEPKKKPGDMREQSFVSMVEKALSKVNLTDAEKTKFEALKKEYEPKFKAIHDKVRPTDEQRKAWEAAAKEARAAGKKGREVFEAANAAMKLTDEQKKTMQEGRKELETLRKDFHEKVMDMLTADQKEQLKNALGGPRGRGKAKPE